MTTKTAKYYIRSLQSYNIVAECHGKPQALELAKAHCRDGYGTSIETMVRGCLRTVGFESGFIPEDGEDNLAYQAGYAYACGYHD